MVEPNDIQVDAAFKRGWSAGFGEPRAISVRYDGGLGRVMLEMTNGCTFAFPARLAQGVERATEGRPAQFEVLGGGNGLRWEALDADPLVPKLPAVLFDTRAYMARRAGQA